MSAHWSEKLTPEDALYGTNSSKQSSSVVPGEALDRLVVSVERDLGTTRGVLDVEDSDDVVSRSDSERVVGRRVEEELTGLPASCVDPRLGLPVLGRPLFIPPPFKVLVPDLEDGHLAVLTSRGNDGVVKGRPGRVKDGGGVASREREKIRDFVGDRREALGDGGSTERAEDGQDGKGSSSRDVPVDGEVTLKEKVPQGRLKRGR